MAIWKKQNKEASACSNEKGKVLLSDDAMETVSKPGTRSRCRMKIWKKQRAAETIFIAG